MLKNISTRVATLAAILTIFFITGLPTLSSAYYPYNYVQTSYAGSDEIPVETVYDIVQTEDGYIWFASYEGLVRYDGTSSYLFSEEDGLPSTKINDLFIDSQGDLWIGTNNAGLALYQNEEFIIVDTTDGLSDNKVCDIEEDSNGNIVIATEDSISTVSENLVVTNYYSDLLSEDAPKDLIVTASDEIFVVTNSGNILMANESDISATMKVVYSKSGTNAPKATAAYLSTDGSIYFGFNDGTIIKHASGNTTAYDDSSISNIKTFYESDGVIYVCGSGGLGIIYNDEVVEIEGFALDNINSILKDYEGNYWIGSARNGVVKLVKNSYFNVSGALGLPELTVNATAIFNNDLYVGADEGLVVVDGDTKEIVSNDLTQLLNGKKIQSFCVIDDSLWISTFSSAGIVVLDSNGSYELINTSNSDLPANNVRFTMPLQDDQVLAGTQKGAAIIRDNEVISVYNSDSGLENEVVFTACQTLDGTIYLGTDGGGFYTIAPDGTLSKGENNSTINMDNVLRLATDPVTDNVWISTIGGLAYIDDSGVHPVDEISEASMTAYDIKFYEDDILLICSDGIYTFDRIACQKGEGITLHKIGEANFSVTPNSTSSMYEDTVLLPAMDGVYAINMSSYYENTTVPKLGTPLITVDGVPVPIVNDTVTIPKDAERITINVSTLSYASDSGYQMTVQLKGFDEQEVVFDSKHAEISYTNIPGGSYELIVTAENPSGIEAEPMHIQVEKEYAFTEYTVVKVFTLLALIIAVALVTYLIVGKVNKAKIDRQNEYKLITTQSIDAIANAIDAKDPYTHGHSDRVAEYSREIGIALGFTEDESDNLYFAGLLHDIGKIGVEGRILSKDGKLTDEEFVAISKHCDMGYDILKGITAIDHVSTGAKYHHERFDGRGYPEGLSGTDIPLYARIICVADAYDAMTSTRPYRVALSPEEARAELIRCKGVQFDPEIVDVMVTYIDNKVMNDQSS